MKRPLLLLLSLLAASFSLTSWAAEPWRAASTQIDSVYPQVESLYLDLHRNPELSYHEEKTAAKIAEQLRKLGYDVTTGFGGTGVVGVFKNGSGPVVMLRAELDALPVPEKTGLPYASHVTTHDDRGVEVPVMHACGHDLHMAIGIGTAALLAQNKDRWHGTFIYVGQPAEERLGGATKMLKDGLFTRFPKPDYCLALHCDARSEYGTVTFTEGLALANVDSVDITVKGRGGHGSAPHTTVDPIVLAARIVLDLQTIVSRETNPTDPCVVSVGSIHGGTKHNIIPDEVKLQITVRTTKDSVRKHTLDAIERIAKAAAQGANAPEPDVKIDPTEFTPALLNDPGLTRKTVAAFKEVLGPEKVYERPPVMGGEDFSRYAKDKTPIFLYFLGTFAPERVAQSRKQGARPLPSLHSDLFYPVPEPSIKTGVLTMSTAVLNLLGK